MKLLSTLLTIGLLLGLNLAMGQETQNFRKYSVGLRVAHLYDLPSYRFDSELSKDMKGLNGPFTSFDLGLNLYGEAQLTPLVGFQGGLRIGGLSGANELEYFENQFQQGYLDMLFVLSNINKERKGLPLNYYAKVGLGVGAFEVETLPEE
ncbi:MAG: hypothetical protein U5L96_17390 [Owenweeksia sp.]|nr:hypothetical protein [Owenweeksia sp.]